MVSRIPYKKKKKNKQSYKHHGITIFSLFCRPGPCNDGMPNSSSALCVLSNRQQTRKVGEVMKRGRCDLKPERQRKESAVAMPRHSLRNKLPCVRLP